MKNLICMGICLLALLLPLCAAAQEYVSIAEIYKQAQAMDGVWQETFDTPNGEMTVDVPIIVPDVETMPVVTVEKAKISEALFNQIASGKKYGTKRELSYETELNGERLGFYLGLENNDAFGEKSGNTGYDAFQLTFVFHGMFMNSRDNGKWKGTMPRVGYYAWELDLDAACVRNSDITLNEAMRLWHEDIALCYPDETFEIRPTKIALRGCTLKPELKSKDKRDGLIVVEAAEQLIGAISLGACNIAVRTPKDVSERKEDDRKYKEMNPYRRGCYNVLGTGNGFYGTFKDENNYRTSSQLARVRTTEYEDVPLVPLDSVLESIREKIESGNIIGLDSIRLGYLLYSNPDMTDYAWAIPRWVVDARYVTNENRDEYMLKDLLDPEEGLAKWENHYQASIPVDVQTGELIIFTYGDAETFSVPEMMTWDKVQ